MTASKNRGPKACTTCAKAKARCNPGPAGSLRCERCHRLNKTCVSQTPAPPRAKRTPKLSKIAALEKRIEELSSHVGEGSSGQKQAPSPAETPSPRPEPVATNAATNDQWFGHLFPTRTGTAAAGGAAAPVVPRKKTPMVDRPQEARGSQEGAEPSWPSLWPSESEADALLRQYKWAHAEAFPFIIVPEHMSVAELRRHRPMLWKAIMMVSCGLDGLRQVQLAEELLADIGRGAIIEGTKSLDLLHGLQLLVAWYNYAIKGTQLTNLLFLARAMCANLGLKDGRLLTNGEEPENLDHMRAYAGTYYINTLVFTANRRLDLLMNTTYVETCCQVLESRMQYRTDGYLVKLVRIQQLAQSILLTMTVENLNQHAARLPLMTVVRSFQDQLNTFSGSINAKAAEDTQQHQQQHFISDEATFMSFRRPAATLRSHVLVAEMLLYEIALSERHTTVPFVALTDRLQLLWACLRSLREYFAIRFSHREMERPRFLCLNASDYVFAIMTGMKLATLRLPGWDLAQVHAELDMVDAMDGQIADLVLVITRRQGGLLPTEGPGAPREDPFVRLMRQLKTLRDVSKMELDRLRRSSAPDVGATPSPMVAQPAMQDMSLEGLDSEFWQSVGMDNVWSVIGDPSVLDTPI